MPTLTPAAQAVLEAAVKQQELGDKLEAVIDAKAADTYAAELGALLSDVNDALDDAIRAYRDHLAP